MAAKAVKGLNKTIQQDDMLTGLSKVGTLANSSENSMDSSLESALPVRILSILCGGHQ